MKVEGQVGAVERGLKSEMESKLGQVEANMKSELNEMKSEMNAANISGEEAPAAMKVAPATSSGMLNFSHMMLSAGTKKSCVDATRNKNGRACCHSEARSGVT